MQKCCFIIFNICTTTQIANSQDGHKTPTDRTNVLLSGYKEARWWLHAFFIWSQFNYISICFILGHWTVKAQNETCKNSIKYRPNQ